MSASAGENDSNERRLMRAGDADPDADHLETDHHALVFDVLHVNSTITVTRRE